MTSPQQPDARTPHEYRLAILKSLDMELPPGATEADLDAAMAYVSGNFVPGLPRLYGAWLLHLKHLAATGTPGEEEIRVPEAIMESGFVPHAVKHHDGGRDDDYTTITLFDALAALRQEELLMPEEDQAALRVPEGVEMVTPEVALAMANTADAATFGEQYDPAVVGEMAGRLRAGEWDVDTEHPVHIDEQGRTIRGLNRLLAIVEADTSAPIAIRYGYDGYQRPLTYRGPAGGADKRPAPRPAG